ncbi:MAG TPA: carbohydrate kinase family protein [Vicinamibacterales bacterium]|jgi:sugar/nucleoside kinase (ribokinase family)
MTSAKKVLVVGEINVDLLLQGYRAFPTPGREVLVDDFTMALGSASAICAMGLAKLGTAVAFAGVVGADVWGEYCLGVMRAAGIDLAPVRIDAAVKTGVTVSITSPSDRALVTYLGSITALAADDVEDRLFAGVDHLHVSSYFLQSRLRPGCRDLFRRARSHGLTTSLDPGFDPAETWGPELSGTLNEVDVFFPNEVELAGITGEPDPARGLVALENGRTLTVAKLGARGAMTRRDGAPISQAPLPVTPIDTTGAGDSFDAGFLHAWLASRPLEQALALGAACGALSTRGLGGTAGQPTVAQAEAFLRSTGAGAEGGPR